MPTHVAAKGWYCGSDWRCMTIRWSVSKMNAMLASCQGTGSVGISRGSPELATEPYQFIEIGMVLHRTGDLVEPLSSVFRLLQLAFDSGYLEFEGRHTLLDCYFLRHWPAPADAEDQPLLHSVRSSHTLQVVAPGVFVMGDLHELDLESRSRGSSGQSSRAAGSLTSRPAVRIGFRPFEDRKGLDVKVQEAPGLFQVTK